MKTSTLLFLAVAVTCAAVPALSQTAGDYRSVASGNWSAAATWETYNGSSWVAASSAPTGTGTITVQSADSVGIDVGVSITGTLQNQGIVGGDANLTIADGGTYEHAQNNGSIPVCTWATGSTCKVTGYVSGSKPANGNQDFYNFEWDCPGQTSNVDNAMTGNTIHGDVTVVSSGASNRVYLTSPSSFQDSITIEGNIYVMGGQFASNGSGSAADIKVISMGNIIVTGGNFSLSRGSGPNVVWDLYGDFSVTDATVQNSGGNHVNVLSFAGNMVHNLTLSNVAYGSGSSYFSMEVQTGSTLNMDTSVISSSNTGSFVVQDGATLATAYPDGIAGAVQCTGGSNGPGNSFSKAANYTFNGTAAQVTSASLPDTVNDLTIDNAAGVTLSQPTVINGVLHLVAGEFDNTIPFTLGLTGSISLEGGTLKIPTSVEAGRGIPTSFYVDQNYPNPFNPSTTISYGLPSGSNVTVKVYDMIGREVATLYSGHQEAGVHSLSFDSSGLSSGVYLYRVAAGSSVDVKRMMLLK